MNKTIKKIRLEDLGYSKFFKDNQKSTIDNNLIPALIIAEHKELYILRNETSEFSAKIPGKMMFTVSSREDYPAVGDWVLIIILDNKQAIIREILPRKTVLMRKSAGKSDTQIIASNIDTAFISANFISKSDSDIKSVLFKTITVFVFPDSANEKYLSNLFKL